MRKLTDIEGKIEKNLNGKYRYCTRRVYTDEHVSADVDKYEHFSPWEDQNEPLLYDSEESALRALERDIAKQLYNYRNTEWEEVRTVSVPL